MSAATQVPTRSRRRASRWWVLALGGLVAWGVGGGCREHSDADHGSNPAPSSAATPSQEELAAAHQAALEVALSEALPVLVHAHPIAAWVREPTGPLRPPPLTPLSFADTTQARHEASRELDDIEAEYLGPREQVRLRALRTGLRQIRERAGGHGSARVDPTVAADEADAFLRRVESRLLRHPADDAFDVGAALSALDQALQGYHRDLGATSRASGAAALQQLDALVRRVERIGRAEPTAAAAAAALGATLATRRTQLAAGVASLPSEPDLQWGKWPPPASGPLRRLPDLLGKDELQRRLEIDEGLDRPLVEAIPQLLGLAERLDEIAAAHEGLAEVDLGAATPVTAARCEATAQALAEALGSAATDLDCAAWERLFAGQPLTEAALRLELVDRAWIDPAVDARQRAAPAFIGLLPGRSVPYAHRVLTAVALALRGGHRPTLAVAHRRMQEAVCLTTAALWVHAELPDEPKLRRWLQTDCPEREVDAWLDEVRARPQASTDGIALALASAGPFGATMLAIAPWAPLGLVPPYAAPFREHPEPEMQTQFQPLEGFLAAP